MNVPDGAQVQLSHEAETVRNSLFERLPDGDGDPLVIMDERDLTIVYDGAFYGRVGVNARERMAEKQAAKPPLPGMELTEDDINRKARRTIAAVRTDKGDTFLKRIMVSAFDADTCRSLFRYASTGILIPISEGDTPESLFLRGTDYMERMFAAAALARIPLSGYTRDKGTAELAVRFSNREPQTVMDIATLTGRNNTRLLGMWLKQLVTTTKGFEYIRKDLKKEFTEYAVGRPIEYMKRPDLLQLVADSSKAKEQHGSVA